MTDRPQISHTEKINGVERTVTVVGYPADEAEALLRRFVDAGPAEPTEYDFEITATRIDLDDLGRAMSEWAKRERKRTGRNPFAGPHGLTGKLT